MRPNRVAPGTPTSQGPDRIYGSGDLPSLERPNAPTATAASKGFKQEQMEQELLEANATIQALEQRMKDLEKKIKALQVQSVAEKSSLREKHGNTQKALKDEHEMVKKSLEEEIRTLKITFKADKKSMEMAFNDEKENIYSQAVADGRAEAEAKTKADIEEYKVQHDKMKEETEKAKAEYPELKKLLTKDISRRESQLKTELQNFEAELEAKRKHAESELEAEKKRAEAQREEMYRKAHKYEAKVKQNARDINRKLEKWDLDLQLREDAVRGRKAQRSSYTAYRKLYRDIHEERRFLDRMLRKVQMQLSEDREKLEGEHHGHRTDSDGAAPGHLQLTEKIGELERGVEIICANLQSLDDAFDELGHMSRLATNATRFRDTAHAGEVMSVTLHALGIQRLRSVSKSTRDDIDTTEKLMKNESNATIRAELKSQMHAYVAEKAAVDRTVDLVYLDHDIEVFETLKHESFVSKATQLAVFDLRKEIDKMSTRANVWERDHRVKENRESLRNHAEQIAGLVKKKVLLLEVTGQHKQDEKILDEMIEKRLAELKDKLRAKRAEHLTGRRAARDAAERAPTLVAQLRTPKSTRKNKKRSSTRPMVRSSEAVSIPADPYSLSVKEARESIATLKLQIQNARDARDIAMVTRLEKERLPLQQRVADDVMRRILRAKTALGPETSSNAKHHEVLERSYGEQKTGYLKRMIKTADDVDTAQNLKNELDHLKTTTTANMERLARLSASHQPESLENASEHESSDREMNAQKPSFQTRRQRLRRPNPRRREAIAARVENTKAKLESSSSSIGSTGSHGQDEQTSSGLSDLMESTSKESIIDKPNSGGLDMKPTSARQAAYQPAGRRQLHDHVLWADFLSQQQVSGGRSVPAINGSFVETQDASSSGADLRTSDRVSGSSVHHAACEREPDISTEAARDDNSGKSQTDATSASLASEAPSYPTSHKDTANTARTTTAHAAAEQEPDISTEVARDDNSAKSQTDAALASLSPDATLFPTSYNDNTNTTSTMADHDAEFVPAYEISSEDKRNALIASRSSTASFWKYTLYKNARGEAPTRHYCTSYEQTEAQAVKFLGATVVGFDIEWERFKSKAGEDSAKRCVSLLQLAVEDKVALFHLANFRGGDSVDEMVPPSLRAILEDPNVIKVGVNIGGDATRLRNSFGIEMQGNIELSHLYKLVTFGQSEPDKVNKGLHSLANQVEEVLHLPLAKGAVRTSSWSKRLNVQQIEYAASDAYAGLRLYYELERRRKAMDPMPPRPAFHELQLPIILPDGQEAIPKSRRSKPSVEAPEESLEEPSEEAVSEDVVALQEQDDSSEDSDDIYDEPEDLEAFDALLESQDANDSLPEITYPKLPPLNDLSDRSSDVDDDSSLPSDPLTKPSAATRAFHSPEAATADAWATAWQSQLPATYTTRVSLANLRAYHLWHHQGFDLQETAALLRKEPLALTTVVSYIAEVLQKEGLDFDAERVREVKARLPASVRSRYAKLYAGTGTD